MPYPLALLLVVAESFLLGSIPCGVIVGRAFYGKDPREGGSGSIGMTNMARLFGAKAAAITFAGDVLKGALAVGVARALLACAPIAIDAAWQADLLLSASIMVSIAGHVFCPWLGFRGGKGIATGLGSIAVGYPPVVALMLGSFLLVAALSRRISAGSIVAACMFPVASLIFQWGNVPLFILACCVAVFVTWAHRANIVRMAHGEEPKFAFKRGGAGDAAHGETNGEAGGGAAAADGEAGGSMDTADGGPDIAGADGEGGRAASASAKGMPCAVCASASDGTDAPSAGISDGTQKGARS